MLEVSPKRETPNSFMSRLMSATQSGGRVVRASRKRAPTAPRMSEGTNMN